MDKPTKPTDLMPRSFGGIKANWSDSIQETGYEPAVPAIYSGSNLNYQIDATGKELDYCEKIVDFINDIPIGKTITVDSNNKLTYADFIDSNKANINLDNINTDGENVIKNLILETTANTNLSNLTELGENRLHALKGYLDEGEALTDTELYNDVHSYANSTFDISKFAIIGTPKITDDGIASNLSTSNYLTAIPSSMYYNKSNWHLQFKGKFDPTIACGFMDFDNDDYAYLAYMDGWHSITLQLYDVNNQQIFISIEQADNKFVKGDILFDIYYSSTSGYYFTATQNGTTYTSSTSSNTNQLKNASTQPLLYIHSTSTISIDLKTIKFFVDNQPVFNGNTSGIDTVYTDNYTVVGSPTISSNGVASGFDNNNYLTKSLNLSGSSLKLRTRFKTGTLGTTTQVLFDSTYFVARLLYVSASSSFFLSAQFGDGTYLTQPRNTNNSIQANTEYIGEFELIQGESARVTLYKADGTLIENSQTSSGQTKDVVIPNSEVLVTIGHKNNNNFSGSIYLDDFAVYSNNKCIYRPDLRIPYVLSSTGSKIVDSAYRDRVIDIYKQEGKARYYTIDYTNKNATLPMGEVYGLIESEIVDNPDKVQSANLINIAKTDVVEPSVYKKLEADYHSSFDVSKFTKVGSPVITDDGIITSTDADTNYIYIPETTIAQLSTSNTWKIQWAGTLQTDGFCFAHYYSNGAGIRVDTIRCNRNTNAGNNFNVYIYVDESGTKTECSFLATLDTTYNGKSYICTLEFTGTQYIWTYQFDNENAVTQTLNNTNKLYNYNYSDRMHVGQFSTGSIDLKQFSITVDGYPVFNGNKTGLDILKPDDYTVVGTPTITVDGVASGFSSANYITGTVSISGHWEIQGSFNCTNVTENSYGNGIICSSSTDDLYMAIRNSGIYMVLNGLSSIQSGYLSGVSVVNNTDYKFRLGYDGTKYYLFLNGKEVWNKTSAVAINSVSGIEIGTRSNNRNALFNGSIDLNSIRIYVNGNLVYQPCLKVPYTFSKDGKKIVDAIYQDRVIDVYNQYGSALYTIINENKKTYNLPMGSMQGFVASSANADLSNLSASGKNAITNWIMPDYANAITYSDTNEHTATKNGYVIVDEPTQGATFYINSTLVAYSYHWGAGANSGINGCYPVGVGDKFQLSDVTTVQCYMFVPCKGGN